MWPSLLPSRNVDHQAWWMWQCGSTSYSLDQLAGPTYESSPFVGHTSQLTANSIPHYTNINNTKVKMSSKIKNITRLVQGKTLAKASVSAARASAAASKTTTERPLTTDVDNHPPVKYKEAKEHITLNVPRKQIWDTIQHRNSSGKNTWEQAVLDRQEAEIDWEPYRAILEAYQKEMQETEGFDELRCYSAHTGAGFGGGIVYNIGSKDELAVRFNGPVKSAIELYNKEMGAKFKLVEVEKANWRPARTYLITFTAAEENDEPKVFQAALLGSFSKKSEYTVTLCRQKANRLEGYRTDEYFMGPRR